MLRRLLGLRDGDGEADPAHVASAADVHMCPACGTSFVCPTGWSLLGDGRQVCLVLRCGQCEAWRRVTVSSRLAERLDREWLHAQRLMARTLAGLERRRVATERDR